MYVCNCITNSQNLVDSLYKFIRLFYESLKIFNGDSHFRFSKRKSNEGEMEMLGRKDVPRQAGSYVPSIVRPCLWNYPVSS